MLPASCLGPMFSGREGSLQRGAKRVVLKVDLGSRLTFFGGVRE